MTAPAGDQSAQSCRKRCKLCGAKFLRHSRLWLDEIETVKCALHHVQSTVDARGSETVRIGNVFPVEEI